MSDKDKQLREAWESYQQTSHPEDMMSYMEFRSAMGVNDLIETDDHEE
jgi:hypothetical protein